MGYSGEAQSGKYGRDQHTIAILSFDFQKGGIDFRQKNIGIEQEE